jgi:Protein of unknown function (DUF3352)
VRALAPLLLAAAFLAAGCGGDGGVGSGEEMKALSYFPPDAAFVAVVSTDVESDQFRNLDRLVRRQSEQGVEEWLREWAQDVDLSYDEDLKPLLGHELAVGIVHAAAFRDAFFEGIMVAFRAADADKLRELLERDQRVERAGEASGADLYRLRGSEITVALDDDVLVYAGREDSLRRALDRADGDDHLTATFDEALTDLSGDALVRIYADAERAVDAAGSRELERLRELPWVAALVNAGASVSFDDEDMTVDFALNTDADRVDEGDLPLATGGEAPEVLEREGEVTGGNRNQSLTTAFLFRAAELAFADSRFVRDVHALEEELGIDFAEEVLRQFDGPSASSVSVDGQTFAARSEVSDPEGLKALLPRLAPHLPRLVVGLQGLQSEGQALLFLFAPDVLVLQADRVEVTQEGDLWRVTGLEGEGPDELWFGVLDDVFVVASTEELARRVATEETVEVEGARGAGVLRVDLSRAPQEALDRLGLDDFGRLGELVAWLEASEERLRGQLRVEVPD